MEKGTVDLLAEEDSPNSIENVFGKIFTSVDSVNVLAQAYEKAVKISVTGLLSLGLWAAFLYAGYWHASTIKFLTFQYIEEVTNSDLESEEIESRRWQNYERATALVNDTAKTLYAVLTPLATAATGFYFSTRSTGVDKAS